MTDRIVMALVSLVASGGIGAGAALLWPAPPRHTAAPEPAVSDTSLPDQAEIGAARGWRATDLPTIVTNLSGTGEVWIRVDATLVSREALEGTDAARIQEDFTLFLRSLRLDAMAAPSDIFLLRDELQSRASLRTDGRVEQVILRTLLFE